MCREEVRTRETSEFSSSDGARNDVAPEGGPCCADGKRSDISSWSRLPGDVSRDNVEPDVAQ